ncbi:MAG: hypothetical protein HYZ63_03000 [Candidatus Andersenbacteria bacterium]|nr:hypothetical protein [Candidatus Andersenbacteria bacterium]
MTIKLFLLGTLSTFIAAAGIFALIINFLDPVEAKTIGFILFFLTLFLAVASIAALVGYAIRRFLFAGQHPAYSVRPSLRQGVWLGIFLDILLFLQLFRLLQWWIAFIIVLLFLSLEVLFLSYDRQAKTTPEFAPRSN